jgi:hypothetical protein
MNMPLPGLFQANLFIPTISGHFFPIPQFQHTFSFRKAPAQILGLFFSTLSFEQPDTSRPEQTSFSDTQPFTGIFQGSPHA